MLGCATRSRLYTRPREGVSAMDVSTETFQREVIERSHELPVVVDFWAAWCGPCRMLGPVLENEVAAREGQVVLAKVDVDANEELAVRYRVQGIPAVKAFRRGHVVDEFVGALPPQRVGQFLDRLADADENERERIRRLAVAIFADLGSEHPLAIRYRRRLASALY